MLDEKW